MTRKIIIILNFIILMSFFSLNVYKQEKIKKINSKLILELAPVDPRSLLQGDYMVLRYDIVDSLYVFELEEESKLSKGFVMLEKDDRGISHFVGVSEEWKKGSIAFRKDMSGTYSIGADSYFFEEGTGDLYQGARYAEFYIYDKGKIKIKGLLNKDMEPISLD